MRKMITKSGMSWGIYRKLQVTRELLTVNLHILLKIHPAAYRCKLEVIPTVLVFAVSVSDNVCLFLSRDTLKWTTADIMCLIDTNRKFFDGKVVWWCLSQHIVRILHETYANHHVITYDYCQYSNWNQHQNADFALFELIKRMNLDITDSACLHVLHILQYPTSCQTTWSTHYTMVNAPKQNFSLLPAHNYGKLTKKSTCWCHQVHIGKSGLVAGRVWALGALLSLGSKKKLAVEKRQEMYCLSNNEKEKWI
jgi:hypothetical protein